MFSIKPKHVRRVAFASRLFPRIGAARGPDVKNINKLADKEYQGGLFCCGRSKNRDLLSHYGCISESTASSSNSFIQLPIFRRSLKKLTDLVEQELEAVGGQQILLPTLVPLKLWYDSKRLTRQQNALDNVYQLIGQSDNPLLLGPTFEETVTLMMAQAETITDRQLPILLYQSSPKFRLETNPRFGLIRTNEFHMNDLYSFDISMERAQNTYDLISQTYLKVFQHIGIPVMKIESNPGEIGGRFSHEFQFEVDSGEDTVRICGDCNYSCTIELTSSVEGPRINHICSKCSSENTRLSKSLELGHTFLLADTYSEPFKAKFSHTEGYTGNLQMGCYGLGLTRIIAAGIDRFSICPGDQEIDGVAQIRWPQHLEPFELGLVAPAKRSRQFNAGSSEFIERLVNRVLDSNRTIDIVIEDRDKEGLVKRLTQLKCLGIPHIFTVGQRFLDQTPLLELSSINRETGLYDTTYLSEDETIDYVLKLKEV